MDTLLCVAAISLHSDIRGLCKFYGTVEAHIRGLCALWIPAKSCGGFLISVLVNKLPSEIHLIVSREMTAENGMMKILEWEVEYASTTGRINLSRKTQVQTPTGATLLTNFLDLIMEVPVMCVVNRLICPLHMLPLLMSLPVKIFCTGLKGAISACKRIISGRIAAQVLAAKHVEGDTRSPSAATWTQTKEFNPLLAHKSQEPYSVKLLLFKVVPLLAI